MGRKPVRPLRIGVNRGGYNPNPRRFDPGFAPAPAGIPFDDAAQNGAPAPIHAQERNDHPIRPLQIGVHRGGYNPNPRRFDPDFSPAPSGFPFESVPESESLRAPGQNGADQQPIRPLKLGVHRGGCNPEPDPDFVPAPVQLSSHELPRKK